MGPYNTEIDASEVDMQWQQAAHLLIQLLKSRIEGTASSYSSAVSVCVEAAHWQAAFLLLELMQKQRDRG